MCGLRGAAMFTSPTASWARVPSISSTRWPWGEDTEEEFEAGMAELPERWGKELGIDWVAPSVAGQPWARQ
jgi:hypothetical protein